MGLSFRKSVKVGPARLNLSKSGLGVSLGIPGARLSINSKGINLTFTLAGITYRKHFKNVAAALEYLRNGIYEEE